MMGTVASNGTNGVLVIDTKPTTGERFEACKVSVTIGPGAATTAPTTLKLEQSDADDTNYASVMPFVGGTATSSTVGFVIPSIATSAATVKTFHFGVDCRRTKRFLKVSVVPGTTAAVHIAASLEQPSHSIAPNTSGSGGDFFLVGPS